MRRSLALLAVLGSGFGSLAGCCDTHATATSGSATGGTPTGGTATGGGTTGNSTTGGSSSGGSDAGPPIVAPDDQWTWVPFPDAFCANGSATGIGVNPSDAGSQVLIYLEGGGACWSQVTCYTLMTAANFTTGYGETDFAAEAIDPGYLALDGGFFDRGSASNPFKDASYVYVPYCTGDLHAGANPAATYGTNTAKHVGFQNMTAYLSRLVPTFPAASRVFLAGSSAGGFGALWNWWQTQQAFGGIRVDMIDDSGTLMPPDVTNNATTYDESAWRAEWNLAATLPPGCSGCATRLDALYGFYAQAFPSNRGALLSYTQDSTLPSIFGISESQFTTGLDEELTTYFAPSANLKSFLANGSGHVLMFQPTLQTSGVSVEQFLGLMTTDSAAWASIQ